MLAIEHVVILTLITLTMPLSNPLQLRLYHINAPNKSIFAPFNLDEKRNTKNYKYNSIIIE